MLAPLKRQTTAFFFLFHFYPWLWRGKIGKRKKPTSNQTKLQYSLVLASCRLLTLSLGLERRTLAPQEIEVLNSAMLGKPHLIFFFIFSLLLRAVGFGRNWRRERERRVLAFTCCFTMDAHVSHRRRLVLLLLVLVMLSCAAGAPITRQRLEIRKHLKRLNKPALKSIKVLPFWLLVWLVFVFCFLFCWVVGLVGFLHFFLCFVYGFLLLDFWKMHCSLLFVGCLYLKCFWCGFLGFSVFFFFLRQKCSLFHCKTGFFFTCDLHCSHHLLGYLHFKVFDMGFLDFQFAWLSLG